METWAKASLPAIVVAFAVVVAVNPHARAAKAHAPVYTTGDVERGAVNSSALGMILGELRTNIADFIWVKTELYSHRGLKFKPHEDAKEADDVSEVRQERGKGGTLTEDGPTSPGLKDARSSRKAGSRRPTKAVHDHAHNHHEGHDHAEAVQWIPSESADFRGFVGTIHREVHPYGRHEFAQGSQILPWYRIQTAVNPRQARAYVVAGWLLLKAKNEPNHLKEAERFLLEGAKHNPEFFPIRVMLGRVLLAQGRHDEAIAAFEVARDLALKKRTPDGKAAPPVWEDSDEEDFGFAVRYIPYIQFRLQKKLEEAEQSTLAGLKFLPRDQPLNNFLKLIRRARDAESANDQAAGGQD